MFALSILHALKRPALPLMRIALLSIFALSSSACNSLSPVAAPTVQPIIEAPRVALVLGGGGAKGFAHVGVIKVLEDNGITPTLIVGTSIGSLIGSLYASGYTAKQLEQLALSTPDSALTDFTLSNQGFIEGIKLKNFINARVGNRAIEEFPIAFAAIATEKNSLTKTVFTQGNAGLIVQASCSIPNIFIAPRIPEKVGKKYIDGGVVSLVPVDSARDLGADIIIAVDVTTVEPTMQTAKNSKTTVTSLSSFWGLLENNIASQYQGSSSTMVSERQRADIVIMPRVSHISSIDTSQRRALIAEGAKATNAQITAIKDLINKKSASKYATL